MKTELRLAPHTVLPDQFVFEIWHDGKLIGQVCGADGPGIRVLSKYPMKLLDDTGIVEVHIDPREKP